MTWLCNEEKEEAGREEREREIGTPVILTPNPSFSID
jgi:hypothetical protein